MSDESKTRDNSFKNAFEDNRSAISGIFHAVQDASNSAARTIAQKTGLEGAEKYAEKVESPRIMEAEINTVAALKTIGDVPGLIGKAIGETIKEHAASAKPAGPKV